MRINIYGGPGAGKSKLAGKIYDFLKENHISCELSREYVKKWAYKNIPITGYMNLEAVVAHLNEEYDYLIDKKVRVVVSDSPILLGLYYARKNKALGNRGLELIALEHEKLFPSINIFLKMNISFPYDKKGRYETKEESQQLQYKLFSEVTTFYSTHFSKYTILSTTAGDEKQTRDILNYLKEAIP